MLVTLLSLLTLEGLLRLTAPYLGPHVCTELFRTYSNEWGGIYFTDPLSKINFMRPNDRKRAAVSGYQWRHETDQRGLRNPPETEHEVLVFGDSFLYGHGVEEPDTAVAQLRSAHGWKAYNMARQGDSITAEYVLFRLWFDELRPKRVILCAFGNDFLDVDSLRSPAEQADPPEVKPGYMEGVRNNWADPNWRKPFGSWWSTSYTYRLCLYWQKHFAPQAPEKTPLTTVQSRHFDSVAACYTRLFEDLVQRARQNGCEVNLVFVDAGAADPSWSEEIDHMDQFFGQLCRRNHVLYFSTKDWLRNRPDLTLPNDGHLNPAGHRALADFIAREIGQPAKQATSAGAEPAAAGPGRPGSPND